MYNYFMFRLYGLRDMNFFLEIIKIMFSKSVN